MGLIADALAPYMRCVAGASVAKLSPEDKADFDAYVAALQSRQAATDSTGPSVTKLAALVGKLVGETVSRRTLGAHIRGECRCGQDQ